MKISISKSNDLHKLSEFSDNFEGSREIQGEEHLQSKNEAKLFKEFLISRKIEEKRKSKLIPLIEVKRNEENYFSNDSDYYESDDYSYEEEIIDEYKDIGSTK